MQLRIAVEHALDNEAIFFLGSGASVGAKNQNSTNFKVGDGLLNLLCDEVGIKNSKNLQLAVEHYVDAKREQGLDGEQELITLLRKEFTSVEIAEYHKQYPTIPWKRIYTTNYDDIVERAYILAGKNLTSYTLNQKRKDSDGLEYIHINGSIKNLNKSTLNSQFKLTDISYTTESFEDDSWGKMFIQDLKTYSAVIFIGFSLDYDLDLKRLIKSATAYQDKCIFIVWEGEDDDNIRIMSKYGTVYKIGCKGFFDEVANIKITHQQKLSSTLENTMLNNFNFVQKDNHSFTQQANDTQVFYYYTMGNRVSDLYYPQKQGYQSIVKRSVVERIMLDIEAKNIDVVFLHSDIGNGKSEVIEQIIKATSVKYNVFVLQDYNEKINHEIEIICNDKHKSIVILENFFNYKPVFDLFKLHNTKKNVQFILTSRTSIYKNQYEAFAEDLSTSTYDINRLDDDEVAELVRIFNEYGYYLTQNNDNKMFIENICKRKMQSVMLQLFKHQGITHELQNAIKCINNNELKEQYVDFIGYLLVIKIMSFDFDFYEIIQLCNEHSIDIGFEKNQYINEFVDIRGKKTNIKSSALAIWLLNQISIKNKIFNMLSKIARKANDNYKINKKSASFLRNVVSFKHLKFLLDVIELPEIDKKKLVNEFYESNKNLKYYENKYFFWLQYGIAAIEMNDLGMAEMHFRAAYAKCSVGMEPFEVNNHYARLKIEKLLLPETSYSEQTIIQIEDINKLLTPTSAPADDEYYSYKMAASYFRKIFNKFYSSMTDEQRNQLKSFARHKYNLCKAFKMHSKNTDFISKLSVFEKEFLYLACYSVEKKETKAKVVYVLKYFVKVIFTKDDELVVGQIRLSDTKRKKFKVDDIVSVKIKYYNPKYKLWELELIE